MIRENAHNRDGKHRKAAWGRKGRKMRETRWAVAGTGYIANEFAKGLQVAEGAVLAAVASRRRESGEAYAQSWGDGSTRVYTDYREMLEKEPVDIVYIAVPNDCHYGYIMAALEKGIPVLSEKPMVDNLEQLKAVRQAAEEKGLFLMEGMWTRCFPAVKKAREWMETGRIGKPLAVRSSFDIAPQPDDWQPWKGGIAHAGGSLRDVGIYALAMAYLVFPQGPEKVHTVMKSNGEVDESFHMFLEYGEGRAAFLSGAFNQISSHVTEITGEKGRILIGPEFWHPTEAVLMDGDQEAERFEDRYPATGFQYEILEAQRCLENGETESPCYTAEETWKIAELIEKTRKEWGIIYQADTAC